jgi:hypothetical protein
MVNEGQAVTAGWANRVETSIFHPFRRLNPVFGVMIFGRVRSAWGVGVF